MNKRPPKEISIQYIKNGKCSSCGRDFSEVSFPWNQIPEQYRQTNKFLKVNNLFICMDCLIKILTFNEDDYTLDVYAYEIQEKKSPPRELSDKEKVRRSFNKINKKVILERDAYRCKNCNSFKNLHVDHIIPVCEGGTNDFENLQTLCATCNLKKGRKLQ